jgi:cyclic 2,3-diphosphoglycerate synthetase
LTRALVLIDGEHYPPTTRWGLEEARARGFEPVACLFVGGTEKLGADLRLDLGNVPVERPGGGLAAGLGQALVRHRPEVVLDLSDEPVLGYRERMELIGVALAARVRYVGADFSFDPPVTEPPLGTPALAVIGTGKRTGKTAIAAEAARAASAAGLRPVIVAMGRGGPPEPQLAEEGSVDLDRLLDLVRSGEHAASDYLEDALTAGVTTVGARRCGGGLAGRPFASNVPQAAALAEQQAPDLLILEGSGASVPPVPWDAGVLVCPANAPEEQLAGYLGPYRLLISDVVVLTMGSGPDVGPQDLSVLISHVRRLRPDARIVITEFRPAPLGEVGGKKVYFASTAPEAVLPVLVSSLESDHGCTIVGATHHLSDRAALARDLDAAPGFEVLLTELKAAAVDVAAERALAEGAEVVFADNRARTVGGDGELPDVLAEASRLAIQRAEQR